MSDRIRLHPRGKTALALAAAAVLIAALATGCSRRTAGCSPVENSIVVCLEGKPLTWQAEVKPHLHGNVIYGPAEEFAVWLGARIELADGAGSVSVAGKQIIPDQGDAKGMHEHNGILYAPLKQVAEAAGFTVFILSDRSIVSVRR
jgi:hypothetical protein